MRLFILTSFLLAFNFIDTGKAFAQKNIPIIKLAQLQSLMKPKGDTIYVVNFWASWCKPCVQELPYFEKITANYPKEKVKVILVSLDFASELEKKVAKFVEIRKIQSDVVLLDETDYDTWISKIEPAWSGAIPVTFILQHDKKIFINQEVNYEVLESYIQPFLNPKKP